MFNITTYHKGHCEIITVDTNDEANIKVRTFLGAYRPSMHTTCTVENTTTGKVTKVARSPLGDKLIIM